MFPSFSIDPHLPMAPMNRYDPLARPNSHMDEQSLYSTSKAGGGMKKPLLGEGNVGGTGENVELVTVPALGAE